MMSTKLQRGLSAVTWSYRICRPSYSVAKLLILGPADDVDQVTAMLKCCNLVLRFRQLCRGKMVSHASLQSSVMSSVLRSIVCDRRQFDVRLELL